MFQSPFEIELDFETDPDEEKLRALFRRGVEYVEDELYSFKALTEPHYRDKVSAFIKEIGNGKPNCIIVDIDGTIADCEHRRHFWRDKPKNWDKGFFDPKQVIRDTVIQPVADLVRLLANSYEVIYVSGRHDRLRGTTETWLRKHGLYFHPHTLLMRLDGDKRPDTEVKKEILESVLAQGKRPAFAIDDRNSVVAMWRESGITCLQVADGDF